MNISVDDFGWSNGYWRFRTCWCWPSYGSGSGSLQFAFFAILVTARYPRPIFNFNVGVLRWTWRVMSHAFSPAATDRYPPFTLHERGQYPARLSIEYPERLSRGLVLVKCWLLAIPHYLIIGMFTSGMVVRQFEISSHTEKAAGTTRLMSGDRCRRTRRG